LKIGILAIYRLPLHDGVVWRVERTISAVALGGGGYLLAPQSNKT